MIKKCILLADKIGTKKPFLKVGDKIVRSRRNSRPGKKAPRFDDLFQE